MRSSDEKLFACLVHLSIFLHGWGILIALVVYLLQKGRSSFMARHSMQSLVYQVALFVLAVIIGMLGVNMYPFGFLNHMFYGPSFDFSAGLATLIGLVVFVLYVIFPIWASVQGFQGRSYRYPVVGKYADRWL